MARQENSEGHIERIVVLKGTKPIDSLYFEHFSRYVFAKRIVKGLTVLDCACGTGYGTYTLAQNAKEVVGIDNDKEALDIASAHWNSKNIRYQQMNALGLHSLGIKFDAVVSFETIEHLQDPQAFVALVYDRLNPKGYFIVSTPNKGVYRAGLDPNPFHLHEYSSTEFLEMLSKKFHQVILFGQCLVGPSGSSLQPQKPSFLSKLKIRILDLCRHHGFAYALYHQWAKKKFAVVQTTTYKNYQYIVAVCRK